MRFMNNRAVAALFGGIAMSAAASAGILTETVFDLSDHPDGDRADPTYGLRLDNLFEGDGMGGATTFSFDVVGDTTMTVTDNGGGGISIDIVGTVYGGVDGGSDYVFAEGAYSLVYRYVANVTADGTGWVVTDESAGNGGSLTSLGNADIPNGTVYSFEGFTSDDGPIFKFLQDGHRLDGYEGFDDAWVGRGWHRVDGVSGTQDFLFVGRLVPSPGAVMALACGGVFGASRRRRR